MTVKWDNGNTTQNATVRAASASGVNSTCESAEGSCSLLDLSCGQLYTFTVTGYTNVCISDVSTPAEKLTGTTTFAFMKTGGKKINRLAAPSVL